MFQLKNRQLIRTGSHYCHVPSSNLIDAHMSDYIWQCVRDASSTFDSVLVEEMNTVVHCSINIQMKHWVLVYLIRSQRLIPRLRCIHDCLNVFLLRSCNLSMASFNAKLSVKCLVSLCSSNIALIWSLALTFSFIGKLFDSEYIAKQ